MHCKYLIQELKLQIYKLVVRPRYTYIRSRNKIALVKDMTAIRNVRNADAAQNNQ